MEQIPNDFLNEKILDYIFHEFNQYIAAINGEDECDSRQNQKPSRHQKILKEILKSEEKYLACLKTILRLKIDLGPGLNGEKLIRKDDFDVIFFKTQELHDLHKEFHDSLKQQVFSAEQWQLEFFFSFDSFGMRIVVSCSGALSH